MSGRVIAGPWRRRSFPEPGARPSATYLAERERLGMPSHAERSAVPCPWCGSAPFEACRNRVTGKREREPHEARRPQ